MGKPDNAVVFAAKTKAYQQNRPLDKSGKGFVTVADVKAFVDGAGSGKVEPAGGVGTLLVVGVLSYLAYKFGFSSKH